MSNTSVSRVALALAAAVSLLAAAALVLGAHNRAQAEDPVAAVTTAPDLHWGFKATWRNYAQDPEVSGGATEVAPTGGALGYDLEWDFDSGSYDPNSKTTHLQYSGTVRWKSHKASADGLSPPPGYSGEPDPYILDVTFTDPQIAISRDETALTVEVQSRDADTWQMIDYGRVPLVNLEALGVTPAEAGGSTTWPGLTATVTEIGHEAMAGFYRVGQVVDPVSFSYEGPGGAPDFSEHWGVPGAATLKLIQNEMVFSSEEASEVQPIWVDRENMIVHSSRIDRSGASWFREIQAFDLKAMKKVGDPLILPFSEGPERATIGTPNIGAYDANRNRLLYRDSGEQGMKHWLRFNLATKQYETGILTDARMSESSFFDGTSGPFLVWDRARNRGYRVARVVPSGVPSNAYDQHEWQLQAFSVGEDGLWAKKSFRLPNFPAGQNMNGYASSNASTPAMAVASDGSLIQLGSARSGLASTAKIAAGYRIVFNQADDAVDVQPLPMPEVNNALSGTYLRIHTAPNGHVVLTRNQAGEITQCKIGAGGGIGCDPAVGVRDNVELPAYEEWRYAIDPADGTIWFAGLTSQKMAAFKNGAFLGAQFFKERNPKGGPVLVGDDHFVYAQTNDGSPGESGGSKTWGFGKFERLGFVPTVTGQPQDDAAALSLGEASEEASFSSTATGDPAPTRQWQAKAPGALKFTNLSGETDQTLTVDATRNQDGAEYRAVYANAAGKVATDPATLTVTYAPLVLQDPVNVVATEGEEAELSALTDGDPVPTVAWQRRVGGFWQDVDPDDENFEIEGQRLTVLETNTEQSGSRFRVKLTNPLGEVISKEAKLTVNPKVTVPPQGIDLDAVSLEWTGSAELQKAPPFGGSNYFSAGPSGGNEATYRAVAGNAAIYQRSSGGAETLAAYATRASHVNSGATQLARLFGGEGRIEPDGSVEVQWDGAFSVNFYGGLVPFTLSNPELEIDAEGEGTLSADLSGFASSIANPNQRTPLAPVQDVVVATFSGVDVDPDAGLTIAPDYAGVEVVAPAGFPPQDKASAGWGAWPQPFVDFHGKTGLASYWYSSGGIFDPNKPPSPFSVDFEGGEAPPGPASPAPAGGGKTEQPQALPEPRISTQKTARVKRGKATLMRLTCPGPSACSIRLPEWTTVRIAGRTYWAKVIAPEWLEPGESAEVKLRLPRAARLALGEGPARVRLRIAVDSGAGLEKRLVRVKLED